MRSAHVCALSAMVGLMLPVVAGAVVVIPPGGIVSHPDPNTDVVQFTSVQLDPQEEWQFTVPDVFDVLKTKTVTLTGFFADPTQQARVWLTYPDAAGQLVDTPWEIMYAPTLFFQAQLPLCPTEVTVHVKNRCDNPMVLTEVEYRAVCVPEPGTLGLLALLSLTLVVRRRV